MVRPLREETIELSKGRVVQWEPGAATVPTWFARQVAAHPAAPALKFRGEAITYRDFAAAADRLARRLRAVHAVDADKTVGMMVGLNGYDGCARHVMSRNAFSTLVFVS